MKKVLTGLATVAFILAIFCTLYSDATAAGVYGRKTFRGTGDNNRNFAVVESDAQLQTTISITSAVTAMADVRLDSIQDGAAMEIGIDLTKLTTGFADRDAQVFSRTFLDFSAKGTATFRLIEFNRSRNWILNNEQRVEVDGIGALTIGGKTDTVAVTLALTHLQQNEITKGRLPGDLLHLNGAFTFRLSDFGIQIPPEALLLLDDAIKVRFDIFATTQ
jgi:polyisoprenoid-binding protein YceI